MQTAKSSLFHNFLEFGRKVAKGKRKTGKKEACSLLLLVTFIIIFFLVVLGLELRALH
jgi:hypothetical protein